MAARLPALGEAGSRKSELRGVRATGEDREAEKGRAYFGGKGLWPFRLRRRRRFPRLQLPPAPRSNRHLSPRRHQFDDFVVADRSQRVRKTLFLLASTPSMRRNLLSLLSRSSLADVQLPVCTDHGRFRVTSCARPVSHARHARE
jgi:hypothetical protein